MLWCILLLKTTKQDNVTFSSSWFSLDSGCRGLFFSGDRLTGAWQMLLSPHRNSSELSGESVRSDFIHTLKLRKGQKQPGQNSQMDQQRHNRWSGPSLLFVSNWTPLISSPSPPPPLPLRTEGHKHTLSYSTAVFRCVSSPVCLKTSTTAAENKKRSQAKVLQLHQQQDHLPLSLNDKWINSNPIGWLLLSVNRERTLKTSCQVYSGLQYCEMCD